MPITTLEQMRQAAKELDAPKVAIAIAEEPGLLAAICQVQDEGLARGILTGDANKIKEIASQNEISLEGFELHDIPDHQQAAQKCCDLIRQGEAAVIMKGQLYTSTLMSVLMKKQGGLNTGSFISHVAVFETERYPKLLFVTDPAINIQPTLEDKISIIKNAVSVAHSFEIETPLVACCCAVENVKESMPATLDAARLTEMNKSGEIDNCIVDGPLAMDNAINPESARIKKISGPVAGQADIILCTDIESANYFYKAIVFFAQAKVAAMVVGAAAPIVLVSRGDSEETKYWSLILGVLNSKIKT